MTLIKFLSGDGQTARCVNMEVGRGLGYSDTLEIMELFLGF